MKHDNRVQKYWDRDDVESMYDKYLLNAEIELIKKYIPKNTKLLDAGCGEGEPALAYSAIPGVMIHAVDFSETRLKKAKTRLRGRSNVILKQVDFLKPHKLDNDYDIVISQRFLINLLRWELQKQVLLDLMGMLRPHGKLLMLEGSKQGVESLNVFRKILKLPPIPIKWHNLFFDDKRLIKFMTGKKYSLVKEDGLGTYFFLTRGIRPFFDKKLNWNCMFNRIACNRETDKLLNLGARFSRLKLWIFQK